MAQINGSTSIDWSDVSLAQIEFETDIVKFVNRVEQILADGFTIIFVSPTLIIVDLVSGGRLHIGGSGFDTLSPIINSFNFNNTATGEVVRFTGTLTQFSEILTSATIGSTSFSETINGNITLFPTDNYAGRVTSLVARIDSTTVVMSGNFNLTGDNFSASLTGMVTGISVVSGANTIKMTGLSLSLDGLEAALTSGDLATVRDLFSFVGNQLPGNDVITYTNNSPVGITLFGGAGNDTITINGLNGDTLNGGDGNDMLNGGLGQDTVDGGAGNDQITMLVTSGNEDTIDAGDGTDTLVLSGVVPGNHEVVVDLSSTTDQVVSIGGTPDTLTQINFENLTAIAIGSSVTVTGSDGNNVIIGSKGNDFLDGGAGNDSMTGGAGNDTYTVDSVGDIVTEALNAGIDKVFSSVNYALPANVESLTLTGTDNLNGTGNQLANILTGNSGINLLTGWAGNDTLIGGLGNDTLNGGLGADSMTGGPGDDVYFIDNPLDSFIEQAGEGTDTININRSVDLTQGAFTEIEYVTLTGLAALNVTGNEGENLLTGNSAANVLIGNGSNDTLIGNAGNDTLNGDAGDDTMDGGAGNDTYVVDSLGDTITETLAGTAGGTDLVLTAVDFTLGPNLENLTLTGDANFTGTGNTLNNILTGNPGNNTLDGGAGSDKMAGGLGNDIYIVDLATDVVTEALNAGNDIVATSVNYTLGANVEHLALRGSNNLNGTGNALNNAMFGNPGNNIFSGLAGNDSMNGGDGNDTLLGGIGGDTILGEAGDDQVTMLVTAGNVDWIDAGDGTDTLLLSGVVPGNHEVVVDLSSATDQVVSIGGALDNTLLQTGFENLNASGVGSFVTVTGSDGDNVLIGSNGNDTLIGGLGNDTLNGGLGADSMTGGPGDDVYFIDNPLDSFIEQAGEGTDTININRSVDLTQGAFTEIEYVTLTGLAALNVTGNEGENLLTGNSAANVLIGNGSNDTLIGNGGNDTLNGGAGDDSMLGGAGNDIFYVDSLNDGVNDESGVAGGTDLVLSSVSFTLGANVENLTLTGSANIDGQGNALSNVITGNNGDNLLIGNEGNDTLIGGAGNDTLSGGLGNNQLIGGAGDDTLIGILGDNIMIGGTGNDRYIVNRPTDVVSEGLSAGTDTVMASLPYTLGANIENLELTGDLFFNGTGNALNNILTGNSGNNTLLGLMGNDTLDGGAGNDSLDGGLGQDTLTGGTGNDVITMLVTAGNVDIIDAGEGTDTLVLSGVVPGNHVVVVDLSSLTDQVVSIGGVADALTQTNFENLTASGIGSSVTVTGSDGDNVLIGSNGNDTINGGAGNDTMSGGLGLDNLQGGIGDDLMLLASTAQFVMGEVVDGGDGADTFRYTGTTAATLTLTNLVTNTERVEIANVAGEFTGIAAINVNAAAVTSNGMTLVGNNGANVLTGTSQADTFIGNAGNDQLRGGLGNDTYQVDRGDGRDIITENDSTAGNSDRLLYSAAINPIDLVLSRQVNDLRIALHGTTESVTIQNWYANPTAAQIETVQAGGQTLLNTQVDGLIQAMAAFTQQNGGITWDQAIEQNPQGVQAVLAASWQS